LDLDDLIQAGTLGLIEAAANFNPGKPVKFATFARYRIHGAIYDWLRRRDHASRRLRKCSQQAKAITREFESKLDRAPDDWELAQRLGLTVQKWRLLQVHLRASGLITAHATGNRKRSSEDLPEPQFWDDPERRPDHQCARRERGVFVDAALKSLPERYQKLVLLYYAGDFTMKQIAAVLGVNESRISQMHKIALKRMGETLQSSGIRSLGDFAYTAKAA
jgi:RNA polymerase sigma factor for flagellar operon FliA